MVQICFPIASLQPAQRTVICLEGIQRLPICYAWRASRMILRAAGGGGGGVTRLGLHPGQHQ